MMSDGAASIDAEVSDRATPEEERLAARARAARRAWRRLGLRLRGVTPAGLARAFLVAVAAVIIAWLVWNSWFALLPFQVGLALAYIMLPAVNWLDRWMPRSLAVLLLVAAELLIIALFVAILVPALANELARFVGLLAGLGDLRAVVDRWTARLDALPEPAQVFARVWVAEVVATARGRLVEYTQTLMTAGAAAALGLVGALGFILSFLVVPTWLVSLLSDQQAGVRAVDRMLPPSARLDFWAMARIVDRAFGAALRGRVVVALLVGAASFAGLLALRWLGIPVPYPLLLALLATFGELVPLVGRWLAVLPAVLLSLSQSWEAAGAVLVLFLGVQFLADAFVAPRVEQRHIDIHPAILALVVVLASQFGLIGLVAAAPLALVARDWFRYVYGRLAEPPRPAGLLPGEPLRAPGRRRLAARPIRPASRPPADGGSQ
jgi:predicted PurR-regulated permease PerM